jgi:uracil-DNA glycosylase
VKISTDWKNILDQEKKKKYFKELMLFLKDEYKSDTNIFPKKNKIFTAFNETPIKDVKVVIIGQDPYHGIGQAHGLSFSIEDSSKLPPSLKNIYKELHRDLNIPISINGNLISWAKQGVLLLNSVLTVQEKTPGSHRKKGWEQFTDRVIEELNQRENIVFMLWGNDAKKKGEHINRDKHLVLESAHPSPFSVKNFKGNAHFSKANKYLKNKGLDIIDWAL